MCLVVEVCSDFGACSVTCGGGTQTCQNTCQNGAFGDAGCETEKEVNSQSCNAQACPGLLKKVLRVLPDYNFSSCSYYVKLKSWLNIGVGCKRRHRGCKGADEKSLGNSYEWDDKWDGSDGKSTYEQCFDECEKAKNAGCVGTVCN